MSTDTTRPQLAHVRRPAEPTAQTIWEDYNFPTHSGLDRRAVVAADLGGPRARAAAARDHRPLDVVLQAGAAQAPPPAPRRRARVSAAALQIVVAYLALVGGARRARRRSGSAAPRPSGPASSSPSCSSSSRPRSTSSCARSSSGRAGDPPRVRGRLGRPAAAPDRGGSRPPRTGSAGTVRPPVVALAAPSRSSSSSACTRRGLTPEVLVAATPSSRSPRRSSRGAARDARRRRAAPVRPLGRRSGRLPHPCDRAPSRRRWRRVALAAATAELRGVLAVGTTENAEPHVMARRDRVVGIRRRLRPGAARAPRGGADRANPR